MAKSLVTGGAGFIGVNLIQALLALGDEVLVLARPGSDNLRLKSLANKNLNISAIDITDQAAVTKLVQDFKPDFVFHLAHYGGNAGQADEVQIKKVIIDGTLALYQACLQYGQCQAIIHSASSSEYGSKSEPMREDMLLEPNIAYGVAKAWATLYGQYLANTKKLPVISLRLFHVYGPYEPQKRFLPNLILALMADKAPQLSSLDTTRDFVYVKDVVRAMILAREKKPIGSIINIGSGKQYSIGSVAEKVRSLMHKEKIEFNIGSVAARSFDVNFWVADNSLAKKLLAWQPQYDLEQGLQEMIEWFKDNTNFYANK